MKLVVVGPAAVEAVSQVGRGGDLIQYSVRVRHARERKAQIADNHFLRHNLIPSADSCKQAVPLRRLVKAKGPGRAGPDLTGWINCPYQWMTCPVTVVCVLRSTPSMLSALCQISTPTT
jgi:hypothetical protein